MTLSQRPRKPTVSSYCQRMRNGDFRRLATQMPTEEKTVRPFPKEIAQAIAAYADKFLEQLRRNIPVTITLMN